MKYMKKWLKIVPALVLVFCLFNIINVFADDLKFKVSNIEVKEKSSGVSVNDVSLSESDITNDVSFTQVGDYIKYNITIKNTDSQDYIINSISDDNDSEYITYEYESLANETVQAGSEKTFVLTITYKKIAPNGELINKPVNLKLNYTDEDGNSTDENISTVNDNNNNNNSNSNENNSVLNVLNPTTGDNVIYYVLFGIISLVVLVVINVANKKYIKPLLVVMIGLVLVPVVASAKTDCLVLVFKNKINLIAASQETPGADVPGDETPDEGTQNEDTPSETNYTLDISRSSESVHNGGYEMPDLYNTGSITPVADLVSFTEKYPNISNCTITAKNAAQYNYTFEGFIADCQITIRAVDNITIRDFKIDTVATYGINVVAYNSEKYPENTVITDGEITGVKSAAVLGDNITVKRLYVHDFGADAFKFGSNQLFESNYIGPGGKADSAHADGIQLAGTAKNSTFKGNRIDMISIPNNSYKANSAIFLKLESGESDNVVISNNWLNGGGYTAYIITKNASLVDSFTNLTFSKNKIGNGYRFSQFSRDEAIAVNDFDTQLFAEDLAVPNVGSIVYLDKDNKKVTDLSKVDSKMKVLVNAANYTSSNLDLTVVSKIYDANGNLLKTYSTNNTINKNLDAKEVIEDESVTLADFPFNVPTTLDLNDLPTNLTGCYIETSVYSGNYVLKTKRINQAN